eukprot:1188275-Prorocentrum_minimum.AAC.4
MGAFQLADSLKKPLATCVYQRVVLQCKAQESDFQGGENVFSKGVTAEGSSGRLTCPLGQ